MKTILCVLALFVLTATTADAYVRRTIGGGHVVRGAGAYSGRYAGGYHGRGYYGHPVARGAAVAAGAAVVTGAAVAAGAATGWGWNQPYYGSGYYDDHGYGGVYANQSYVTGRPTLIPRYYGGYGAYAATGYPGYGGVSSKDYDMYMQNLHESGYDPKNDYTAVGTMRAQ